jgi:DNA invertase Pin-like site-specific DNA recombinase
MNKAYSYIRFSSAEQAKGRSQARQAENCERYCREHGLNLATGGDYTFLDAGLSGYKGEHLGAKGQLTRFIKLVEDGTIERGSTLVVESLDRLSRQDVWDALPMFMNLIRSGIRIVTLSDSKVYSDDGGAQDLILSIFILSRANDESSTKAKRVQDAMRQKHEDARKHGKPMGKAIPMWLELNDQRQFEVKKDRASVVSRIFEMAINGYGKDVTAKALNADEIPSFKGKTWGRSSIDKILHNKAVLGIYQPYSAQPTAKGKRMPSGDPIPNYYPPIVEEATFYQALAAINGRRVSKATKQTKNFNVWQGLAKCVHCEAAMHLVNKGKPPRGNTYLHCYNARKGLCAGKMVRLDHSEEVFRYMLAQMDSVSLVQDSAGKIGNDLAEVDGRLQEQRALLKEYKAALKLRYTSTVEELAYDAEQEISELEKQKEVLRTALAFGKITSHQDFLSKLDLDTYEGRHRANSLLKRLKVLVYIGSGYLLTEKGEAIFVLAYKDGKVGFHSIQEPPEEAAEYTGGGESPMLGLLNRMERGTPFANSWRVKAR